MSQTHKKQKVNYVIHISHYQASATDAHVENVGESVLEVL